MLDDFSEIFSALGRNKLRTALTGLSVSMGIFLLIFLLGAGSGLINAFSHNAGNLAMNVVQVWPGRTALPYDGLESGRSIELDNRDINITERAFPSRVTASTGSLSQGGATLTHGHLTFSGSLTGCFPEHAHINKMKLVCGRYINELDLKEHRKVIVIDEKTVLEWFDTPQAAIGERIKVDNSVFTLIGVCANQGRGELVAHIPFHTLQTIYRQGTKVHQLTLCTNNVDTEEADETFKTDLRRTLGRVHRFSPHDQGALWIWNTTTGARQHSIAMNVLRTALWVIGLLTLLSGVVGISNIMLITVKERTREFGIRKALGARPWQILRGIILESVIITSFFGYIGLVAGVATTEYMNIVSGEQTMTLVADMKMYVFLNPTVEIDTAIKALVIIIIAGVVAGLVPAIKAVRVKPIVALNAK